MTVVAGELSAARVGAELLRELAARRASGVLGWQRAAGVVQLELAAGRAVRATGAAASGAAGDERASVVLVTRALACGLGGSFRFVERETLPGAVQVDVLGEALVAVLTAITQPQLAQVWDARAGRAVVPTSTFETLKAACAQIGAPSVPVPTEGAPLAALLQGAPLQVQRALAAQIFLGGLELRDPTELPGSVRRPAPALAAADPRTRAAVVEIDAAYERMQTQSLYEALGISTGAMGPEIRAAYLEAAKRWHTDRFAGMQLGPAAAKVEEMFRRVGEAQRILTDPAQRKAYDFVLDRQKQGLPTDPGVILEAEALFKKAQGLVRRGQAAAALPLLERAVELNRGEPEFWVYLGWSLYSARGTEARKQAEDHIRHGLEMRDKLDTAHEFLGTIARIEGRHDEARKHLRRALELNPRNVDAERELRIMSMRAPKAAAGGGGLGGLLGKILKRE